MLELGGWSPGRRRRRTPARPMSPACSRARPNSPACSWSRSAAGHQGGGDRRGQAHRHARRARRLTTRSAARRARRHVRGAQAVAADHDDRGVRRGPSDALAGPALDCEVSCDDDPATRGDFGDPYGIRGIRGEMIAVRLARHCAGAQASDQLWTVEIGVQVVDECVRRLSRYRGPTETRPRSRLREGGSRPRG